MDTSEQHCLSNLNKFLVSEAPRLAYYVPNFITEKEEKDLLKSVYAVPKPKWTQLSNRRLQNWGGLPHSKGMIAEKIPQWLEVYLCKLQSMKIFDENKPNHVLVNEYLPGQGIMPHLDGPLYYPTIATINLGSSILLDFYHLLNDNKQNETNESSSLQSRYVGSFFLERRSLVCFKEDMYHKYMHGIEEETTDDLRKKNILNRNYIGADIMSCENSIERMTRVSLTIRNFPKAFPHEEITSQI